MSRGRWLLLVCGGAALIRLVAFFALGRAEHPDVWESETIANNLLAGRGFVFDYLGTTYRSYLEPLYPALCALVYAVTNHSFVAMGVVQAVLGAGVVAGVFLATESLSQRTSVAVVAGAVTAVHPGLIAYATKFHPFALDSLLLISVVVVALRISREQPLRSAALLGFTLGLCVLTRATVLATMPFLLWWVWRTTKSTRALGVLVAVSIAVVTPWVARNAVVHHRFMLTRSGSSFVLWLGNNPRVFTGSARSATGDVLHEALTAEELARLQTLGEVEQQDFFFHEAMNFIRAEPLAFVERWLIKLGHFWWRSPQAGQRYASSLYWLYQAFFVGLFVLAMGRTVQTRTRPETWLLVGVGLIISAVQAIYYVEGRHRLAIEALLVVLAAEQVVQLHARWKERRG